MTMTKPVQQSLEGFAAAGVAAQRGVDEALSAQEGKVAGMNAAAEAHSPMLESLRTIARTIALERISRQCSIVDVRQRLASTGLPLSPGNWLGSVFSGKTWAPIGWEVSKHRRGHGRMVRVWKLIG